VLCSLHPGWVVRQPWRCLCRGSEQMTITRPCRLITRHLLQIFFTLGLTFTVASSSAGPLRTLHRQFVHLYL
jgi:hypothetical protein